MAPGRISRRNCLWLVLLTTFATTAAAQQAPRLPEPRLRGTVSLEEVFERRRSVRDFGPEALEAREIGQLLCAAQGVTSAGPLGLGAVPVGAFDDGAVGSVLRLREEEEPSYLVPVGRPSR